jgi:hypothetical protein
MNTKLLLTVIAINFTFLLYMSFVSVMTNFYTLDSTYCIVVLLCTVVGVIAAKLLSSTE